MKKIYLVAGFVFFAFFAQAQDGTTELSEKKQQDIQALKIAFISKELELNPTEAQKFWPVYNEYEQELSTALKGNNDDIIDRDEKVLNVRKKYKDRFTDILGAQRMNRMYGAEGKFRRLLIKAALQKQQMRRGLRNNNRPLRNQ